MNAGSKSMRHEEVYGDLLDQNTEAIVNPWNRNFIPWWLLLPQGVSGAIKKRGGTQPFKALRKAGLLDLGEAVRTGAGRLPFAHIIHVAGLHAYWTASEKSVRLSTTNALLLAQKMSIKSIAFPLIGGGTGGQKRERCASYMRAEIARTSYKGEIILVFFSP